MSALPAVADMLENDFRAIVARLDCPVSWFLVLKMHWFLLHWQMPSINYMMDIKFTFEAGAAHAPFLSHPQSFTDALVAQARRLR